MFSTCIKTKNEDLNISHTVFTFMRKATGSYRTYSVPGKTTVMVSGFAVEGLSSSRTAA